MLIYFMRDQVQNVSLQVDTTKFLKLKRRYLPDSE